MLHSLRPVAVIVVVPPLWRVITPFWSTDATVGSELSQVISKPVRTFPSSSLVVAVSWVVCPIGSSGIGPTVTVETAGPN